MTSTILQSARSTISRIRPFQHSYIIQPSVHRFGSVAAADVDFFRNEGYVKMEQFFDDDEFRAIRAGLIKLKNIGRLANVATVSSH